MKKTISTLLVLVMVLSMFTSFGVCAEHWAQDALDYVTSNGYWISKSPIEPDKIATRAETASLFARALISKIPEYNGAYTDVSADNIYAGDITAAGIMEIMVGYDGKFRPDDTVSREELAVILGRAAKMVFEDFTDKEYNLELYKDSEQINDWATQGVQNASAYGLMKGIKGKLFVPQGTATIAEVATVVKSLMDVGEYKVATADYHVRDVSASDNIKADFDVLQTIGMWQSCGWSGGGMMVRFDQAPGEIYIARTTARANDTTYAGTVNTPAPPVPVCRVVGPDGYVIARVNMYYKDNGTMEKIINIPNGEPGIYRIQFTCGRNRDMCTIGVKNATSWGVFGDSEMLYTSTTPKTGYIWNPWVHTAASIGMGGEGHTVALYTEDGLTKVAETAVSQGLDYTGYRTRIDIKLNPDTVYMIKTKDNFAGLISILGTSNVICPTAEMARDLKGGYIWYEDKYGSWQMGGPLQVKARQRMVEIYEEEGGDFTVDVPKPDFPTELDNPMAEALMFGAYGSTITNMKGALAGQVLDPSNPWFGGTAQYPERIRNNEVWWNGDWQSGWFGGGTEYADYKIDGYFVGAATQNAELNPYFAHPKLLKRLELAHLAWVAWMLPIGSLYYSDPKGKAGSEYYHQNENFSFGDYSQADGYHYSQYFLSPKTREITDEGMTQIADTTINMRGQGATNQSMMNISASLAAYLWSGERHFLDHFESCLAGMCYPAYQVETNGQTGPLGFWHEGAGWDAGSYNRMAEGMFYDMYASYEREIPMEERNPQYYAKILSGVDRALKLDSMWYTPNVNGFTSQHPNSFTSRTKAQAGLHSGIAGIEYLNGIHPRARKNFDVLVAHTYDPDTYTGSISASRTAPSIMTNDEAAWAHIKRMWDEFDGEIIGGRGEWDYWQKHSWPMYHALHEQGSRFTLEDLPTLPFEMKGDYNVYKLDGGMVAIKHNGTYATYFYNNDLSVQSSLSFYSNGPLVIWDEYFGTIVNSMKPDSAYPNPQLDGTNTARRRDTTNEYSKFFQETDMLHTALIGKSGGAQFFCTGKEAADFKWIEKDKSFEISAIDPFYEREVIWRTYMVDGAVEWEAGLGDYVKSDDIWVQIPVVDPSILSKVEGVTLTHEGNTLTWAHEDKKVILSWDENVESVLVTKPTQHTYLKFLKLKLDTDHPLVRFRMTREMGDYVFEMPKRDSL